MLATCTLHAMQVGSLTQKRRPCASAAGARLLHRKHKRGLELTCKMSCTVQVGSVLATLTL